MRSKRNEAMLVIGARPQFIKSAPVIREILAKHKTINLRIVHSGQHYDPEMSSIFFNELHIPEPEVNLRAGSGSHAEQTGAIMKRLENRILRSKPDMVIVPGDTNTTLAAALTAAKMQIPAVHIEAGLRSGDLGMPEEINRRLTDHCCSLLFAPTVTALHNLRSEGLGKIVHLTGDTMVDAMRTVLPSVKAIEGTVLHCYRISSGKYVLVTLHRPSNVDDQNRLRAIYRSLVKLSRSMPIVFLVHPRTRARLKELKLTRTGPDESSFRLSTSQGYLEALALLKNACCLLTDSGGMQKEAFLLRTPCITLRTTTEWPETLVGHANRLLFDPLRIPTEILRVATVKKVISPRSSPFGKGNASERIADLIERFLA